MLFDIPPAGRGRYDHLHLTGNGQVRAFRFDAPGGGTGYWAPNDLRMDGLTRRYFAELGFGIERDHRGRKQRCGVEGCQARSERARRTHLGCYVNGFPDLTE